MTKRLFIGSSRPLKFTDFLWRPTHRRITDSEDRTAAQKIVAACPPEKTAVGFGPELSREDGTLVNTLPNASTERFEARAKYLETKIRAALRDKKTKRWLITMTAAFDALFCGDLPVAIRLAALAGEGEFAASFAKALEFHSLT